jgi:NADH:ubiquinone oxidoreductase subunit E
MNEEHLNTTNKQTTLYVCMAKNCRLRFSEDIFKEGKKLEEKGKIKSCQPHTCLGLCEEGPNILTITSDRKLEKHSQVRPDKLNSLINNNLD